MGAIGTMDKIQITLANEKRTVWVDKGVSLLDVQVEAGLHPDAPCGGQGTCGKCLVDIRYSAEDPWQRVKACQTLVDGPLELKTLPRDQQLRVLDKGEQAQGSNIWEPWVEQIPIQVAPCPLGESTADWARLKEALSVATGRQFWEPDVELCSILGDLIRETGGKLWAVVDRCHILALRKEPAPFYMVAFDVGTTSIAGYLLRGDQAETVAKAGTLNPQAQYGADVIMRANYALERGCDVLASCVREAVDHLIGQLCQDADVSREDVFAVSLVGNTCMHHLFLSITPDSLVHAPYNPAISESLLLRACEYGLHVNTRAPLLMLPVIAGFVGADTVGCLLAGGWEQLEDLTLMIDIGTNGEIVMGNRHRMIACSTAAGPAFEGAKIQCGMRGAEGAVEHVWLENGEVKWRVIGGGKALGICGSGLIDLVAVLLRSGQLDESGRLKNGPVYRLGDTDVVLTQKDIREMQLAKGAISAGIRLLAERLGISITEIRQVCIAGAFGNYMDPNSACDIGLIPPELREKVVPVGNAAGEGAKMVLQDRAAWDRAEVLARRAEFLELASLPQFQDEFVDQLEFPNWEETVVC